MPETLMISLTRWMLAGMALLCASLVDLEASAQVNPAPPPQGAAVNPMCPRLEAQ